MEKFTESKPVIIWTYSWGIGLIAWVFGGTLLFLLQEWPEVSLSSVGAILGFGFLSLIWWGFPLYFLVLFVIFLARLLLNGGDRLD